MKLVSPLIAIAAAYALFIHDGGALFMHFVDAVAPLLAERMLEAGR